MWFVPEDEGNRLTPWQFHSECQAQDVLILADVRRPADLSLFSCRGNKVSSEWRYGVCLNWEVLPRSLRRILWKPKKAGKKKWQPWHEDIWLQQQYHQSTMCRLLSVWKHAWKERQRQIMGQCFKWPSAKEEKTMITLYKRQFYITAKSLSCH